MNPRKLMRAVRAQLALYNVSGWWNPFHDLFIGGKDRPVFFDIDRTMPELRALDRAYPDIKAELESLLPQQDAMPKYHELDDNLLYSSARYNRDKRWNVFMLACYDAMPAHNRALCPKTCAALDAIPALNQAFFSILDAGKSIPAHCGPGRVYIRYHLGLRVPEHNPPSIRVRDEHYTWREGESVLFDDSWNHEITNNAHSVRAVLIVDVMRPFPAPVLWLNRGLRKLGSWMYGPGVVEKADKFRLTPGAAK